MLLDTERCTEDLKHSSATECCTGGYLTVRKLAHRCRTDQNSATGGQWRPVHNAAAVKARPGGMSTATRTARLVPDEHRARPQPMTVRAALRWPRHP